MLHFMDHLALVYCNVNQIYRPLRFSTCLLRPAFYEGYFYELFLLGLFLDSKTQSHRSGTTL